MVSGRLVQAPGMRSSHSRNSLKYQECEIQTTFKQTQTFGSGFYIIALHIVHAIDGTIARCLPKSLQYDFCWNDTTTSLPTHESRHLDDVE
jgi:hypothetical protein